MKKLFMVMAVAAIFAFASCGSKVEDVEKAKQDSIAKADSIAKVEFVADSIAKADSLKAAVDTIAPVK